MSKDLFLFFFVGLIDVEEDEGGRWDFLSNLLVGPNIFQIDDFPFF